MTDEIETPEVVLEPKAREAVHAARDAAYAVELARQVQIAKFVDEASQKATEVAAARLEEKIVDETRLSQIVRQQLINVLSKGTEQDRALILARVPYICQDIKNINANLEEIKGALSTYPLIRTLVFGFVGLILVSVVGALLTFVVMHH